MRTLIMTRLLTAAGAACVLALGACEIDESLSVDPNAPSINSVAENATETQLNLLVSGLEADIRQGYAQYVTATGSVARELYLFDADPRNTADLLNGNIDNNTFYLTAPYNNAYGVVKTANILLDAVDNTANVTEAEKQGYRGVANTFKALALQRVADMLGSNGIRVDVADPENLGPFLSEPDALAAIETIYQSGFDQLQGADFAFSLSSGFEGFDDPASFATFNRALAARTTLQRRDSSATLDNIDDSYFVAGEMPDLGPEYIFSTASGDFLNPLYRIPGNTGNMIFATPSWFNEAEDGDQRLATLVEPRVDTFVRDTLFGIYETRKFASATSPIEILPNVELHLMRAEALAQTDELEDAVELINIVRSLAGLDPFDSDDQDEVVDQVLRERRYSLWQTGNRFADLRRYGRLNADFVTVDRPGDRVASEFPIPLSEGL